MRSADLQVGIVDDDSGGGHIAQRERFEDGPVLDGMAVAGAVEDAIEAMAEDDERGLLGELAWTAGL